jgi:hypothetical protein
MSTPRTKLEAAEHRGERIVQRLEGLLRNGMPPERAVIVAGVERGIRPEVVAAIRKRMKEIEEGAEGAASAAFNRQQSDVEQSS